MRYLSEAFWAKVEVPYLGAIPFNDRRANSGGFLYIFVVSWRKKPFMTDFTQTPHLLPPWAKEMIALYESRAVNQFVLHGNVNDRLYLPLGAQASLGGIRDFLLRVL